LECFWTRTFRASGNVPTLLWCVCHRLPRV